MKFERNLASLLDSELNTLPYPFHADLCFRFSWMRAGIKNISHAPSYFVWCWRLRDLTFRGNPNTQAAANRGH